MFRIVSLQHDSKLRHGCQNMLFFKSPQSPKKSRIEKKWVLLAFSIQTTLKTNYKLVQEQTNLKNELKSLLVKLIQSIIRSLDEIFLGIFL